MKERQRQGDCRNQEQAERGKVEAGPGQAVADIGRGGRIGVVLRPEAPLGGAAQAVFQPAGQREDQDQQPERAQQDRPTLEVSRQLKHALDLRWRLGDGVGDFAEALLELAEPVADRLQHHGNRTLRGVGRGLGEGGAGRTAGDERDQHRGK